MTFFLLKATVLMIGGLWEALHKYELESPRAAELSFGEERRDNDDEQEF